MLSSNIGFIIKELRLNKNVSRQQLASDIGLSVHTIKSYENGVREPNSKAMVALEQYFNVSGAYLRGETDEKDCLYCWEDDEIMDAVKDGFPSLLKNLLVATRNCSNYDQKIVFDILVEMKHILLIKDDDAKKLASLELLQNVFAQSTRFIDVCLSAVGSNEEDRILQMKQSCIESYDEALSATLKTIV